MSENAYESVKVFVEKVCSQELKELRNEFDSIENGLGEKAVNLVMNFSASFGVTPGEPTFTRENLTKLVQENELDYDFEASLFFIQDSNMKKYYLDPMNRFGDQKLFDSVTTLAERLHGAFSSKKVVEVDYSAIGAAVLEISSAPKILLEEK